MQGFRRSQSKRAKRSPSFPSFSRTPSLPSLSAKSTPRRPRKVATDVPNSPSSPSPSQEPSPSTSPAPASPTPTPTPVPNGTGGDAGPSVWAPRDSVSLRALGIRGRRKGHEKKLSCIEDDAALAALSAAHTAVGGLDAFLGGALCMHGRIRGKGGHGPAAALHASATATRSAAAQRRAAARVQAPPPDVVPRICVAAGAALGSGRRLTTTARRRLIAACPAAEVEYIVYAGALPVACAILHAAGAALASAPRMLPPANVPAPRLPYDGAGALSTSRVPGSWPRVGRWLSRRLAYPFPEMQPLRHGRAMRAIAASLARLGQDAAVSMRLKALIGFVTSLVAADARSAAMWRSIAAQRGLRSNLFRAVKAFVSESHLRTRDLGSRRSCLDEAMPPTQQAVLVWAKECASVVGRPSGAIIDPIVTSAVARHLTKDVMAEIAGFVAIVSLYGRVASFYAGAEDDEDE